MAEAFGCDGVRIEKPEEVVPTVKKALELTDRPTVIEIPTQFEHPWSEGKTAGWWDVPIPAYLRRKNA